jgi:hypothetical protein
MKYKGKADKIVTHAILYGMDVEKLFRKFGRRVVKTSLGYKAK